MRSGRNRHVWVGVLEVLPRYYCARLQLCGRVQVCRYKYAGASPFSVSVARCAQAARRRSALEEKSVPGALPRSAPLRLLPALQQQQRLSGFEQLAGARAAPAVPDVVLSAFVQPVSEKVAADVVHAR